MAVQTREFGTTNSVENAGEPPFGSENKGGEFREEGLFDKRVGATDAEVRGSGKSTSILRSCGVEKRPTRATAEGVGRPKKRLGSIIVELVPL